MKPLPDRLNLRRADLAISADQRHAQSDSRSRHNSIRKIRHFVAAHKFKRICDGAVERRKAARCCRIVERVHQPFPCRRRNPALLDQIGQLNQADRRNIPRQPWRKDEHRPSDTRRWRAYRRRPPASDIFPGEVRPHLALVLFDFFRRERNPEIGPKTLDAFERLLGGSFFPQTSSVD